MIARELYRNIRQDLASDKEMIFLFMLILKSDRKDSNVVYAYHET